MLDNRKKYKNIINMGEKTAATPAVISDANIADNAIITIDFDGVGGATVATGAKVHIYYTK